MDNILGASNSSGGWGSGGPQVKGTPGRKTGEWQNGQKKSEAGVSDYEKKRDARKLENAQVLSDLKITTPPTAGGRGGGAGSRGGKRGGGAGSRGSRGGRGGASGGANKRKMHSYSVDDMVLARFKDGAELYKATIQYLIFPDRYVIKWTDGDVDDTVKCEDELQHDLEDAVDVDD